ncbi:hypothetical protein ACLMJK_002405 [Lecanora helva]
MKPILGRPFSSSLLLPTFTLLLSTLIALTHSATLPTSQAIHLPSLPLTEENETLNATDLTRPGVHCQATIPLSVFYLTMHGCAGAIAELSNSQTQGAFHTGEPFNEYSLPVTKTSGYCKVKIEMHNFGIRDDSSWLQVSYAATQLNLQCASRYKYRYAGGWSLTGQGNGIKISLTWYSNQGGRNETIEALIGGT